MLCCLVSAMVVSYFGNLQPDILFCFPMCSGPLIVFPLSLPQQIIVSSNLVKVSVAVKQNRNHIICIAMSLACLVYAIPTSATVVVKLPGGERKNVSHFIAAGTDPIDIRVIAIRDWKLVSAILKGCRTRQICLLADNDSPELEALVGRKNLHVRISTGEKRGKFGQDKLSYSFVLKIGKGYFQEWAGPLIWTKSAFGPRTQFLAGNGYGPGESWPNMARTFDRDFSEGLAIKRLR